MGTARLFIDPDAERVVRKLARGGHEAYLVGGCVRDLLLDREPKDFDVATSATPNEIRDLFRNCRIVGRRFRLAHVYFGPKIIETSTFRANPRDHGITDDELLIRRDNVFGSATEDAHRRDFTINGLFYNVETEQVIDYVGGLRDLEARLVRTIGNPDIRFQEDPVRMLRAIKFAARLGFTIEPRTYEALLRHRDEITKCAPPRVLEEVYRLLRGGAARRSMQLLAETGIDRVLSPRMASLFRDLGRPAAEKPVAVLDAEEAEWRATWAEEVAAESTSLEISFIPLEDIAQRRRVAWRVLDILDERVRQDEEPSNSMILAAIVNPFLEPSMAGAEVRPSDVNNMILELCHPLVEQLRVARRDAERLRQVLLAQRRLSPAKRRKGRPAALLRRDYFDEALAIYEITALAASRDQSGVEYWNEVRSDDAGFEGEEDDDGGRKRRRRRRGGRRRRYAGGGISRRAGIRSSGQRRMHEAREIR